MDNDSQNTSFDKPFDQEKPEREARLTVVPIQETIAETKISTLDKIKLELENEKLKLEKNKFSLERDKLLVSALIEDFKARWQELLNLENENSRWQTLYVTALILVVSWVLSNSGDLPNVKYQSIKEIFNGENSYLVLGLAFVNAIYTLAMAYKGFQIQEIAQYLYISTGKIISRKTFKEFNSWERWRRDKKGRPVSIRTLYYSVISILPTMVSGIILFIYYKSQYYENHSQRYWLNWAFYIVLIFVAISFFTALYTLKMNWIWKRIFSKEDKNNAGS